jgi:hypothetical protein
MLICALLCATAGTALSQTVPDQADEDLFLPALSLRADGRHAEAKTSLREILTSYPADEAVAQLAYQHLFTTLLLDPDPAAPEELASTIREALLAYPDLTPSEAYCPREIVALVQAVRVQMYGSLEITSPAEAEIILDGEPRGMSPLLLKFVLVGDYDLTIAKDGYKERQEVITIEPGSRLSRDVELSKKSNKAWYIAGGAALVGGTLYLLLKDDGQVDEPLAEPPPPPAR